MFDYKLFVFCLEFLNLHCLKLLLVFLLFSVRCRRFMWIWSFMFFQFSRLSYINVTSSIIMTVFTSTKCTKCFICYILFVFWKSKSRKCINSILLFFVILREFTFILSLSLLIFYLNLLFLFFWLSIFKLITLVVLNVLRLLL